MSFANHSLLDFSLPPVLQIECEHPPVGGGGGGVLEHWLEPQSDETSLTHCPSHLVLQQ